ncbi:MerR family transcriptional regulator [Variovorax dokdonensis]|uniref:MerR family transcriptional regulator n=1 Tax=Variovorax dokdonensis TaxID=344883 RepID=UPI0034A1034F
MDQRELSELTGVSARTIKRYVNLRLIHPAVGRTRAAVYDESHRADVMRVHALRAAGWGYERIREEMDSSRLLDARSQAAGERMSVEYRFPVAAGVSLIFSSLGQRDDVARLKQIAKRVENFLANNG